MFFLYTQPVIEADAVGIFLLAIIVSLFVIPRMVRKSKISDAEEIKNRYPDGFKKVMRQRYSIDYQYAKEIVENEYQIASAQKEYDAEQRKAAEEKRIREKASELRRKYPNATLGESDKYIVEHEYSIRQAEDRHREQEAKAKTLLKDYPLGVKEVCGYISTFGSLSDDDIKKIISNENTIRSKQREIESNEAELKKIRPQFYELNKKYPLGVSAVCTQNKWSTSNAEHLKLLLAMPGTLAEKQENRENFILHNKQRLDSIVEQAKSYVGRRGFDYGKTMISQQYGDRILDKVMGIIQSEERFKNICNHLDVIAKTQNDFAKETRDIFPIIMNNWGWYNYNFEMEYQDEALNEKSYSLTVWQAFYAPCCFDDSVSYEYYPSYKKNRTIKKQLESNHRYGEGTWNDVLSFISNLKEKYGDEVYVLLVNTDHLDAQAYNNNIEYFENQLKKRGINYGDNALTDSNSASDRKYVVIDIVTFNSELIRYCSSLFHYRHIMQLGSHQKTTGVVYVSILKCFDGAEVEKLNQKKIREHEEELRKAREEEARKQKDEKDIAEAKSIAAASPNGIKRYFPDIKIETISASNARLVILRKTAIRDYDDTLSRLRSSVSNWDTVRWIPHYFFYYYYPTRFTDISAESQEVRRMIYAFKDGINHIKVRDIVVSKIRATFNSADFAKMCFVCIPASTKYVNQTRYEDFSKEVCQALGMENAFDHITIVKEKTPSRMGGTDKAEYTYDRSFFNGKFVVLFDDIVTRGDSISSMKSELESFGAIVICAISIGRTYSDWNGNLPKPHPYTGNI